MPVKKTSAVKKSASKVKTAPAKKKGSAGPAKGKSTKVASPKKKGGGTRGGFHREINDETGFVVGTDQDVIATALLEGGASRADIVSSLEKKIDLTTRNGTEKQITNMVSGVINKMLARGYTVESSFVVNPPTPASKRAAARRANAAPAKTPAKKTAAKKTTSSAKKGKAAGKRK